MHPSLFLKAKSGSAPEVPMHISTQIDTISAPLRNQAWSFADAVNC